MTDLYSLYECSLSQGGTPPRFLIIDDGWQQIENKAKEDANAVVQEGAQYGTFRSLSFIFKAIIIHTPSFFSNSYAIFGKSCFVNNGSQGGNYKKSFEENVSCIDIIFSCLF